MASHASPVKTSLAVHGSTATALITVEPGADASAPQVLTVPEIARELRCSKAHVHNIIAGKVPGLTAIPTISLGRRRLVRRASFEAWMEANEHAL